MKPFQCSNCGECCGPVPVNKLELQRIQKKLSRMPKDKLERLKNQKRDPLTCMFRDVEKNECGIYNMRPEICKMFGLYEGMKCPRNHEHASIGRKEGVERMTKGGKHVGILTMQITWENIFERKD
jgi:Fe-S-cluster containining protein